MQTHSRAVWKPRVNPLTFLSTKLQNFWPRPRTSKSSSCWEHNTVTCGSGKRSLCGCSCEQGLISGYGRPQLMWVRTATIILLTCTCCSGCPRWVSHPWVLPQEYTPKKTYQESPFPPSSKGEGRKSVQDFKRSWSVVVAAPTRPIPKIPSEPWGSLLCGEQRGCQTNSGNSSHKKQGKATGKRLLHQTDVSISSPGSTGSCHRNKIREREMCRWDLSPAILLLFHPAAISCRLGLQIPPCDSSMRWIGTWFWQLQAWQTLAWAGPTGAALPKRWLGGKKKKKTKRKRSWSAGALWFVSRGAPQPVGSAAQGALPGEESSALSFSLFHVFLVEPEEHLESSPSLGYQTLKGYERALIWGKNRVCPPWPWWLVLQNECPETGNIWELGRTKHLCGPGDLYSAISTSCQRKRQEIIWETEDHI